MAFSVSSVGPSISSVISAVAIAWASVVSTPFSSAYSARSASPHGKRSVKTQPRKPLGRETGDVMANSGNQKQKLLCLMRMLQEETDQSQGLSMPQIIERLEEEGIRAERKALYRDLQALRDAGFDIQKLPTRPVQYSLVRSELGLDDVMMLVDLVQSSPFLTERRSNQLVRSLKKLVSERERKKLAKRVHVQGRIRNQNESIFHNVDKIHEALQAKRKIEFLYFGYDTHKNPRPRHDGKRYVVTPVKVVYADSNYYLAAYDDADELIKTYRVDRMKIAQMSDKPATRCAAIANYDTDAFAYQRFSMYHGEPKCVTLRVEAELMDVVVDRFGRDVEVTKATDNYAEIRVNVQVSAQFFGWLAGLDGKATIKTPRKLKEEYRTWLKTLAERA